MQVVIKDNGCEDVVYDGNFLVLHAGDDYGTVNGQVDLRGMLRCVEILLEAITDKVCDMPIEDQLEITMMLADIIVSRLDDDEE